MAQHIGGRSDSDGRGDGDADTYTSHLLTRMLFNNLRIVVLVCLSLFCFHVLFLLKRVLLSIFKSVILIKLLYILCIVVVLA